MNEIKKRRKVISNIFTTILDLAIALTIIATFALGYKYAIEIHSAEYAAQEALKEIDTLLSTPIARDELNSDIGEGMYKIKINNHTDWIPVISGDGMYELSKGVGHHTGTGHPGDGRQIFLSAHRNTYFKILGDVRPGETITIFTPYGKYEYIADRGEVVEADDIGVINFENLGEDELVLMTCYPFENWLTAEKRYLLYAYPKPVVE